VPENEIVFFLYVENKYVLSESSLWRSLCMRDRRSVQANIEYLYIRSYGQTASVTSNLRVYSRT
jgi:hypothetical protein